MMNYLSYKSPDMFQLHANTKKWRTKEYFISKTETNILEQMQLVKGKCGW